jgi:uncharacterized membrane protein YcaP (DUF421 family)
MNWLTGNWMHLGGVVGKAGLMYATALLLLRVGERRTLAQWTLIDFVAAIAVGAIVGRTATAPNGSWITGAVALATIIAVHRLMSLLRFRPLFNKLTDHRIRVLVADGRLRRGQLRLCGLTDNDVLCELRQRGIFDLANVRYLLYETKGGLTVVRRDTDGPLIDSALDSAAGARLTRSAAVKATES